MRVDRPRLLEDYEKYKWVKLQQEDIITSYLGDIDISKPAVLARAIIDKGYAYGLPTTPTGRLSTAKASIEANVNEPTLLKALRYRATLQTLTGTFFKGWVEHSASDGHVHPSWNQVKSQDGGARTGRFSCSEPNLTNVPTEFGENETDVLHDVDLPFMRQYILPDEGQIIVPADFNGQEMRIMAHYAEGRALEVYNEDPTADFHAVASALIKQYVGLKVPRKMCKIVGFSLIYGIRHRRPSRCNSQRQASQRQRTKHAGSRMPTSRPSPDCRSSSGSSATGNRSRHGAGGCCPAEDRTRDGDGEWRTFNYKLCNYLIQGSAADQSKEAMLRYVRSAKHGRLLMMVHDELVISVPRRNARTEIPLLR